MQKIFWSLTLLSSIFFFTGCENDETILPDNEVPAAAPFQELYDQGIDRYLGVFTPTRSEPTEGGVTLHSFQGLDGPICFTGNEFTMSTRDGSSNELLIFLQGGGACGPESCDAVEDPIPLFPLGMLDAADTENPTATYNLGYVPYCDGSLFTGDREVDSDGDGTTDRFFRGVQNLSASLDVIAQTYPAPTKILLAGNSAGGAGVHYALPLVRKLYPDVRIEVINDSGVGISQPGVQESLNDYWNSGAFFPASCNTCIGEDGHLTDYFKYQLAEDDNIRMGFISSTQDELIAEERLMIGGDAFEAELVTSIAELSEAFPDRFQSLITDGNEHTFILRRYDFQIGNTSVKQWVGDMLSGEEDWESIR